MLRYGDTVVSILSGSILEIQVGVDVFQGNLRRGRTCPIRLEPMWRKRGRYRVRWSRKRMGFGYRDAPGRYSSEAVSAKGLPDIASRRCHGSHFRCKLIWDVSL
jgi:hypothetical protein